MFKRKKTEIDSLLFGSSFDDKFNVRSKFAKNKSSSSSSSMELDFSLNSDKSNVSISSDDDSVSKDSFSTLNTIDFWYENLQKIVNKD